jgi:hypothetical protein
VSDFGPGPWLCATIDTVNAVQGPQFAVIARYPNTAGDTVEVMHLATRDIWTFTTKVSR